MDLTPEQIQAIIGGILQIIGAFSVTAAIIPKPAVPFLLAIQRLINMGAFNFGKAKNESDK